MGRLPHLLDDRAAPSYVSLICPPWPTPPSPLASSVSHSYSPSFALSLPAFPSPLAIFTWISSLFTIALLSRASLLLSFASLLLSFISLPLSFTSLSLSFTLLSLSLASRTPLPSSPPSAHHHSPLPSGPCCSLPSPHRPSHCSPSPHEPLCHPPSPCGPHHSPSPGHGLSRHAPSHGQHSPPHSYLPLPPHPSTSQSVPVVSNEPSGMQLAFLGGESGQWWN